MKIINEIKKKFSCCSENYFNFIFKFPALDALQDGEQQTKARKRENKERKKKLGAPNKKRKQNRRQLHINNTEVCYHIFLFMVIKLDEYNLHKNNSH